MYLTDLLIKPYTIVVNFIQEQKTQKAIIRPVVLYGPKYWASKKKDKK